MYKALHAWRQTNLDSSVGLSARTMLAVLLRSAERGDLIVPRAATKFGDRAFAISSPLTWNGLPATVRNSSALSAFKSALKTHLFI